MNNITGSLVAKSKDIELHDCDWKSVSRGLDVWFEQNGWEVNNPDNTCKNDLCKISHNAKVNNNTFEVSISGECSHYFDYTDVIDEILNLLDARHVVISGRLIITESTKVIVISFDNNRCDTKEATFK